MLIGVLLAVVKIGGVFPLLCTPYSESGDVDYATLAKEARFVADCGANGIIWPSADDALKLLTPEEERQGWAAIAEAIKDRDVWFCPCCPGMNVTDQLRRLKDAEATWRGMRGAEDVAPYRSRCSTDGVGGRVRPPGAPLTALVRMVNDATNDVQYAAQYEQVAAAFHHPVIIQTYNGKSPMPSMKLMIDLARRFPETYGWFKVEGSEKIISEKMSELVAAKPDVKTVFTGWGGRDWLYQYRQIGTRGVISQRPMYADLMVKVWKALEANDPQADELFAKFMYLRNLDNVLPSANMRGWNLEVLKQRGVFKNTLSREPQNGGGWKLEDLKLTDCMRAEIAARLKYAGVVSAKSRLAGEARTPPLRGCGVSPHRDGEFANASGVTPRLRVGLFCDNGCRGNGLARWAEMLALSPDADCSVLSGEDIRKGGLHGLDLLVMPGGRGDWQYAALGEEGAEAVREFVANGGKYFGTCCGLAMALNEDKLPFRRIKLLPYKRVSGPVRGGFVADVKFNARGLAWLGLKDAHRGIRYHNGPIVEPAETVPLASNIEVLATMDSELSQHGPVVNGMYGTPAAIRARYGKGEVLAFNCHPEARNDTRDIVAAGIRALTGKEIPLPEETPPKGREIVGVISSELGNKAKMLKYLDLKRDPKLFVVPLTKDEINEGRAAQVDRIIELR